MPRYLDEIVPAVRKIYFENEEQVVVCPELVFLALEQPEIIGRGFTTREELLEQPFVQAFQTIHNRLQTQGISMQEHGFYLTSWRAEHAQPTDICLTPRSLLGLISDPNNSSLSAILTLDPETGELCSTYNKGKSPRNPTLDKVTKEFPHLADLAFNAPPLAAPPLAVAPPATLAPPTTSIATSAHNHSVQREPNSRTVVPDSEAGSSQVINEQPPTVQELECTFTQICY